MTKVAVNKCYGRFGISDEAFELLLTRKGYAFDKVVSEGTSRLMGPSYYHAGLPHSDDNYISEYKFYEDRADPDLIFVIEQLGDEANSWAADIDIVEIPDDVKWHISEYDGLEHVAEDHRTWF